MLLALVCALLLFNREEADKTDDITTNKTTTTSSRLVLPDEDGSGDVDVIVPTGSTTNSTSSTTATGEKGTVTNGDELVTNKTTSPTRGAEDDGWLPDVGTKVPKG